MKDPVYFNPSVQKKFENLQSVVPFEFEDDSPKKFSNPPSFSFKTIPTEPEVVTDLPKYTYSVKTSTSVNAFINFGENEAEQKQENNNNNNITDIQNSHLITGYPKMRVLQNIKLIRESVF